MPELNINNGGCSLTVERVTVARKTRVRLSPFALNKLQSRVEYKMANRKKMVDKLNDSKQTLSCFSSKDKVIMLTKLKGGASYLKADAKLDRFLK